jgi:hypothetical protein
MNRRSFICATTTLVTVQSAFSAVSDFGGPRRRAWVEHPTLVRQNCPLWCWAASISMIFASNGHQVLQEDIVQRTFGAAVCMSSGNPISIARSLSQTWVDTNENEFDSALSAAYDASNGVDTLDNAFIVEQLSDDKPLLYCNSHHAMVLVSVDYIETPYGPKIVAAGVLDPWPGNPGFHPLSSAELFPVHHGGQLTFLAAVNVS